MVNKRGHPPRKKGLFVVPDRPTPIPPVMKKGLIARVGELETGQGRLLGEVGDLSNWKTTTDRRMKTIEEDVKAVLKPEGEDGEERISQIDGSLRPNRGRLSIRGYPPWMVALVFVVAIIAAASVLVVWLTHKS